MVKRFTVKGWNDDHIEVEDPEGKWVRYADYAEPEGQQPVDWQRVDDALVSSISLLRTLGRDDEVVHVAIAELEFVRSFLSTLEPAELEDQQEPVVWTSDISLKIMNDHWPMVEVIGASAQRTPTNNTPLYTHPLESSTSEEQAVTEAMVVAATEEYFAASFKNTPSDAMRIALKAAMEAGR